MAQRILVAVDLQASDVFESALTIASATASDLLLLHVLSPHAAGSPALPFGPTMEHTPILTEAALEIYQKQWKDYVENSLGTLQALVERAEAAGVTADFMQSINEPGRGICAMAKTWDADIIAIGSHQRKGLQELLIGSVSNYVMHHAPCSVLVVALGQMSQSDKRQEEAIAAQR